MQTDLFIDGEWRKGGHGTVLEVENPATEEIFVRVEQASVAGAHQAVDEPGHVGLAGDEAVGERAGRHAATGTVVT